MRKDEHSTSDKIKKKSRCDGKCENRVIYELQSQKRVFYLSSLSMKCDLLATKMITENEKFIELSANRCM